MTITDLELEKLAVADKLLQRKANTLGKDRSIIEEPFRASNIILRDDIFAETPTANTGFYPPEYGEAPNNGSVATRHSLIRLHPLVTSGQTGLNSIQTFVAVSAIPESDDPRDIEAVRIKHIIPPDLSMGRSHAAEDDGYLRGFQIAIYPAKSTSGIGTPLDAYTDMGPIPVTADPSAVDGVGNTGRWTFDYANGILRLSVPPLNGATGVFNPKNVFGDRNGNEVASGRLTLFATFYRYTGPKLTDEKTVNVVTVGDGTDSYGSFYGPTSSVMQSAVDSLYPMGGTIFVNSGTYSFYEPVIIPSNVHILGLSNNAKIYSQNGNACFRIMGSNSSIKGLQLFSDDSRGAIEFSSDTAGVTIEKITIADNIFYSNSTSVCIGFAPYNANIIYKNCYIKNNLFKSNVSSTTYIAEISGGSFSIDGLELDNNIFDNLSSSHTILSLASGSITLSMKRLRITNNRFGDLGNINLNNSTIIDDLVVSNNSLASSIIMHSVINLSVKDSGFNTFTIANGARNFYAQQSDLGAVSLDGYVIDSGLNNVSLDSFSLIHSANNFKFTNSNCFGNAYFRAKEADANFFGLNNVYISGNKFFSDLQISNSIETTVNSYNQDITIDNNIIEGLLRFAADPQSAVSSITLSNLKVTNNTIADVNRNSVVFGDLSSSVIVTIVSMLMQGNLFTGDIRFQDNVDFNTDSSSKIVNNVFDGSDAGIFFNSVDSSNIHISENTISKIVFFGSTSSNTTMVGSSPAGNIFINDNILKDAAEIVFAPVSATPLVLDNVHITGNTFVSAGTITVLNSANAADDYRLTNVSVNNNKLSFSGSSMRIGPTANLAPGTIVLDRVEIKDNLVNGTFDLGNIPGDNINVSHNKFGATNFEDLLRTSVVSNNITTTLIFDSTVADSSIEGNQTTSTTFSGAVTSSIIGNNSFNGALLFSSTTSHCSLVGNTVDGNVTFNGCTDTVLSGNDINGLVSSTTWTDSQITNLSTNNNFTATNLEDTTISNSFIDGTMSIDTFADSILDYCTIATNLTLSSVTNSSVVGNIVDGNFSSSGGMTRANITNNIVNYFGLSGTLSSTSFANNITNANGADLSGSTLNQTSISGNVFASTSTNTPFSTGNLTDCTIIGNVIRATNASAANSVLGTLSTTTFASNTIDHTNDFTFGAMTDSKVLDSVFECDNLNFSTLTDSVLQNTEIKGALVISSSSTTLLDSSVFGCNITGTTSIITSSGSSPTLTNSSISNNTFDGTITISGAVACAVNSNANSNVCKNSLLFSVTGASGQLALDESTVSDNAVFSNLVINNTSGSAANVELVRDSIISNNTIVTNLSIGLNVHITDPGNLIEDSVISGNKAVLITIGPSGRSATATTYMGTTIGNNATDDFTVVGALVGCTISNNAVKNDVSLGTLNGSSCTGNTFGADGTGNVTLAGGLAQSGLFNSNFVAGVLTLSVATSAAVLANNTIVGAFAANSTLTDTHIDGNNFSSSLTFSDTVSSSEFINNGLSSTLTFSGNITSSTISDNNSSSSLTFSAVPSSIVVDGNKFSGITMSVSSNKDEINITNNQLGFLTISNSTLTDGNIVGNRITGTTTISSANTRINVLGNVFADVVMGSLSSSTFNSNESSSDIDFTGAIADSVISGNAMVGGTVSADFQSTVSDTSIVGNKVLAPAQFLGAITDSTITGNNFYNTFTISNTVTDSVINSNTFNSTVTFPTTTITTSEFCGNHIAGVFSAGSASYTYTTLNIENNVFDSTFSIGGRFSVSKFNGNHVGSTATFSSSVSNAAVSDSTINDNTFGSTLTISFNGSADATDSALRQSVLSNNKITGLLTITSAVSNSGYAMYRSTVDGNSCNDSITIVSSDTTTIVMTGSVVQNNIANNLTINSTFGIGAILGSTISSNSLFGDMLIAASLTSNTSGRALENSVLTNNSIAGSLVVSASGRDGDVNTIVGSAVSNNSIGSALTLYGEFNDSTLNGNTVVGAFTIGALSTSVISGNHFDSTAVIGSNANANPVISVCTIADNDFMSSLTLNSGSIVTTRFTGNLVITAFAAASNLVQNCVISNNEFASTFTTGRWDTVTCTSNLFVGAFSLNETDDTLAAFDNITFNNNICKSTTTFNTAKADSANEFNDGVIIGNSFVGNVSFGNSAGALGHDFDQVVFVNNVGNGSVTFYTTGTSNMDGVIIMGNSMAGTLAISGATYTSPMTSTSQPTIALNRFNAYSGITFSDGLAIGWGDNSLLSQAVTIDSPGVVGSNGDQP